MFVVFEIKILRRILEWFELMEPGEDAIMFSYADSLKKQIYILTPWHNSP